MDLEQSFANVEVRPHQQYEQSVGGQGVGYLHLPFGTYKAWCLIWQKDGKGDRLYSILDMESTLTPYSCRWDDYKMGHCKPEAVFFNISPQTTGASGSCNQAEQEK
jgi:hypothetical protein